MNFLITFDGGVSILPTTESMHLLVIPRLSDHSGNRSVVCNATTESFHPSRTHELKKTSNLETKFPSRTDSVIRINVAADIVDTKLWALRSISIP